MTKFAYIIIIKKKCMKLFYWRRSPSIVEVAEEVVDWDQNIDKVDQEGSMTKYPSGIIWA